MDTKKLQLSFFIGLLLFVFVLTLLLFKPFVAPLALAFMAAVVVRPVNRWFLVQTKGKRSLSAFFSVLFVLLVILVPLAALVQQVAVESIQFYGSLRDEGLGGMGVITSYVVEPIQRIFPSFVPDIEGYIRSIADSFVSNARQILSTTASAALGAFIAIVGMFYMLRDGDKFKRTAIEISPLSDTYDNEIIAKIERAVNSVVRGSLFTSLVKGVLAAIGFWIFHVPHAALWGAITAIVSLLPGIGAGLTIIPAALYLLAKNEIGMAIGLGVWGIIVVGLVDNILMPIVVGKGFTVHPLLVLLSVLGGIAFFGPVGLFLGPLVVALLSALIEIYKLIVLDDQNRQTTQI
ncbi:MAG TPA: AI-2E family transporter [Candidatus Paceibacterota bacterium]